MKVLLIEKDTSFRGTLTERLQLEGLSVFLSEKESDARKLIRRRDIDVILLSLVGLKREGLSLLAGIKKYRPLVEVIILTGPGQIDLSIAGMKQGAYDDFLIPFDIKSLVTCIHQAAEKKKEAAGKRKGWVKKCEELAVAISFAEVGEHETARQILGDKRRKK